MGKLFGTDGIRGVANEYPMTAEVALSVGKAVVSFFRNSQGEKPRIVIGKDTRVSGSMITASLAAGITAMGGDALLAGVIPTPAVSYLVKNINAVAGIVVSASHNPYHDNGIKVFGPDGCKLTVEKENELEARLLETDWAAECKSVRNVGKISHVPNAIKNYVDFLLGSLPNGFSLYGMTVVLDCANGATHKAAPEVYRQLGAIVQVLHDQPNGMNINENCGSQHPESVKDAVLKTKASIGLAFDGDGDRLIAVDEKGEVLSGDQIIAVCARHMKDKGELANNMVVTTVMSNMGLKLCLEDLRIQHETSDVGDRHVFEKMRHAGAMLGGEDSGHLLFLNHHTTGDGLLSSLQLLSVLKETSMSLSELKKVMTVLPQQLINVSVSDKPPLSTVDEVQTMIDEVENELAGKGRVLVRYSGTQPMCRIMVEGPTVEITKAYCEKIAGIVEKVLG